MVVVFATDGDEFIAALRRGQASGLLDDMNDREFLVLTYQLVRKPNCLSGCLAVCTCAPDDDGDVLPVCERAYSRLHSGFAEDADAGNHLWKCISSWQAAAADRKAGQHMQMIGDPLSNAIVAELPGKV